MKINLGNKQQFMAKTKQVNQITESQVRETHKRMKEDTAKQYQTVLSAQAINKISGEDEDPEQEEDSD